MAVRFAPFAKIKVFSLASYFYRTVTDNDDKGADIELSDYIGELIKVRTKTLSYSKNEAEGLNDLFDDVALATSVSITETYNTRSTYGIGQPANPVITPGNVSIRVNMSRLTTDARHIADYITKPTFYYSAALQKLSAAAFAPVDLDLLFYSYFFINSLEKENYSSATGQLQNVDVIAFMPNTYTRRIEGNRAEIVTDVEGEGKLFEIQEFIDKVNGIVTSDTIKLMRDKLYKTSSNDQPSGVGG